MTRSTYTVLATPDEGWWTLEAPDVRGLHSQSRDLDGAESAARDAIATMLDVPADAFDVIIEARPGDRAA